MAQSRALQVLQSFDTEKSLLNLAVFFDSQVGMVFRTAYSTKADCSCRWDRVQQHIVIRKHPYAQLQPERERSDNLRKVRPIKDARLNRLKEQIMT